MAFNPSQFFNDYNQFSPLYSADAGQNSQRLQQLNDALAYVKGNPNLPNAQYLMGELQKDIAEEQNMVNATQTPTAANQAAAIGGIRLPTPDYNTMLQQMQGYLQKQIQLQTPDLLNNAYQSNYNLKNNINQKMMEAGLASSGARQKALARSDASAVKGVTGAMENMQDTAAKEMGQEKQNLADQNLQRQGAENRMKSEDASNQYKQATGNYENAFNANTQAKLGQELTDAQEALLKAQQPDFLGSLIEGAGKLAGQGLGTLISGAF